MKKITFILAALVSSMAFSQTYTETFSSEVLQPVLSPGLNGATISTIAPGDGRWFTISAGGVNDFAIQTAGGNPDGYVSRATNSQFGKGLVYVYNNSDNSVTGTRDFGFDYFYKLSFDNLSTTNERFSYRVLGLTATPPAGLITMASGSGDFGDDNSSNYTTASDFVTLKASTSMPHTDTWATTTPVSIDFGAADTYKYIVVAFGQVFGGTTAIPGDIPTFFGIDNVILPTQSNPVPTTLSNGSFDKSQFIVHPNPVGDILNIDNLQGEFSYKITDVLGRTIKSKNNQNSTEINLSDLNSGQYIIEIENKGLKSVSKIIKK